MLFLCSYRTTFLCPVTLCSGCCNDSFACRPLFQAQFLLSPGNTTVHIRVIEAVDSTGSNIDVLSLFICALFSHTSSQLCFVVLCTCDAPVAFMNFGYRKKSAFDWMRFSSSESGRLQQHEAQPDDTICDCVHWLAFIVGWIIERTCTPMSVAVVVGQRLNKLYKTITIDGLANILSRRCLLYANWPEVVVTVDRTGETLHAAVPLRAFF